MENRRVFLCLVPDEGPRGMLRERLGPMRERPWSGFVRWTREEHWHVDLGFFPCLSEEGEERLSEELSAVLGGVGGFCVDLESVTVFPRISRPRALAVTFPVTEGLRRLRGVLQLARRAAGAEVDDRQSFRPHITLGRMKAGAPRIHSLPFRLRGHEPWVVGEVELWRSVLLPTGPVYDRVGRWGLKV